MDRHGVGPALLWLDGHASVKQAITILPSDWNDKL